MQRYKSKLIKATKIQIHTNGHISIGWRLSPPFCCFDSTAENPGLQERDWSFIQDSIDVPDRVHDSILRHGTLKSLGIDLL